MPCSILSLPTPADEGLNEKGVQSWVGHVESGAGQKREKIVWTRVRVRGCVGGGGGGGEDQA